MDNSDKNNNSNGQDSNNGNKDKGDKEVNIDLRRYRGPLIWLIIVLVFLLLYSFNADRPGGKTEEITYHELKERITNGSVESIVIAKETYNIKGKFRNDGADIDQPQNFKSKGEKELVGELSELADRHGVSLAFEEPSRLLQVIFAIIPYLLIFFLIYFLFFRQMKGMGGGGVLSFGKSRATRITPDKIKKTFDDVAGINEAKEEVYEIIEFLRDPDKVTSLGGRLPRGVMLIGEPGTGKTLLAKAIAGEANVPFFSISGSDFVEMFVGVGASRVRDLFEQAKENAPCIIFLDEIDAVGRKRGTGYSGGHDEREQTLNAILVEMDGFDSDQNVIVMGATNRPDVLDPALLRPGRFDRRVFVDLPDLKGREEILKVHSRDIILSAEFDLQKIARGTPGFSGAELENVINEAALLAAMKKKKSVEMDDLEEARDKVRWGKEKRSRAMTPEDKKKVAYHEAGHALLNHLLEEVSPLHKVTIIQRGRALGATMQLPEKDEYNMYKRRVLSDLKLLFAGRVAEEFFCDDISSGAANDIERATSLARSMVCEWGMSDEIGLVYYGERSTMPAFGGMPERAGYSQDTARAIDAEVKRIIDTAYVETRDVIKAHKSEMERITDALVKYEVLSGEDVADLIEGMSEDDFENKRKADEEKKAQLTAGNSSETDKDDISAPPESGAAEKQDPSPESDNDSTENESRS
ncbi:MAG: ATP-dependent zinc metalloprotease FtsH [Planctomycetota bacterium]